MKRMLPFLIIVPMLLGLLAGCKAEPQGPNPVLDTVPPAPAELPGLTQSVELPAIESPRLAEDREEILTQLAAAGRQNDGEGLWFEEPYPSVQAGNLGGEEASASVQRGELVQTDGDYLYTLDSYGLTVLSAKGAESQILSYTRVPRESGGGVELLFVAGDRAAVVSEFFDYGTDEAGNWFDHTQVHAAFLDISDRSAPKLFAETLVDGALLRAGLVGERLYLVTEKRLWNSAEEQDALPGYESGGRRRSLEAEEIWLCPNPVAAAFTLAAGLDLKDGSVTEALAFTDGSEAVCMDGESLLLARTVWSEGSSEPYTEAPYRVVDHASAPYTELKRVDLAQMRLTASALIPGSLLNSEALGLRGDWVLAATADRHTGYGVYTDENHGWSNLEPRLGERNDRLTVLDRSLQTQTTLERLNDRGLTGWRYVGDLACYTDGAEPETLRLLDLRDPRAPAKAGSLPLGEELYLRALDGEHLLCFQSAGDSSGCTLAVLDTADPAAPALLDRAETGDAQAAQAGARPLALLAEEAGGLVGWGIRAEEHEFVLFRWADGKLTKKGAFALELIPDQARCCLLDGLLYVCGVGTSYVLDPEQMKVLAEISNAVG